MAATRFVQVSTTLAQREQAEALARRLVESGLAACVQIVGPIASVYRWKGEVCRDEETLLLIKSRRGLLDAIAKLFSEAHPYEVPELIATDIAEGGASYLRWLDESLEPEPGEAR
jgi:periplasmic divalent cation tolerance protein